MNGCSTQKLTLYALYPGTRKEDILKDQTRNASHTYGCVAGRKVGPIEHAFYCILILGRVDL